jgi:GT2 family glycosyltransferase
MSSKETILTSANRALREKKYAHAVKLYLEILLSRAAFTNVVIMNIEISGRLNAKKFDLTNQKSGILQSNFSPSARTHLFVNTLKDFNVDFELINSKNKTDYESSLNLKLSQVDLDKEILLSEEIFSFIQNNPYSNIYIVQPGQKEIMIGLLYKLIWHSQVILDFSGNSILDETISQYIDFFTIDSEKQKPLNFTYRFINKDDFKLLPKRNNSSPDQTQVEHIAKYLNQLFLKLKNEIQSNKISDPEVINQSEKEMAAQVMWVNNLGYKQLDPLTTAEQLFKKTDNKEFIKILFKLALNRDPSSTELNHYDHLIKTKQSDFFGIAKLVFSGEESKRYFSEVNSLPSPFVKNTVRLPKIGEIKPEELNFPNSGLNPTVSIIIPVYEKLEYTLACLKSILDYLPKATFEILVLDDQSKDGSDLELNKVKNIRVIRNPQNLGFLKSCNAGSQEARGKYIFFLNNDTKVTEGWLDKSIEIFDQRKDVGMVGSKLIYPDGTLQEAGGIVWKDGSAWNYGRGKDPSLPEFNYIREVDYCSGAAILLERELFEKLGRFDERYVPAYYEDNDLAFKIRECGKKVIYQPRSVVIHFEGISHGTDESIGLKAYQVANSKNFFDRWAITLIKNHYKNGEKVFLAKDRSFDKKTVLIIDHYVPQPDRDAGSKSMWHIINTLIKNNINVKFWPHNNYYDPIYSPWLENIGVEVIAGNHTVNQFKNWIIENGSFLDQIFLSRPHISVDFIDLIKQYSKAKTIYYGHDIHYLRLEKQHEVTKEEKLLKDIDLHKKLEEKMWKNVDVIYYPSIEEEVYVNNWLQKESITNILCRTIPVYAYDSFEDNKNKDFEERSNILFVAGFGHPPNIDGAIWFVEKIFPLVIEKNPNVKLTLVGSNPTKEVKALACDSINVTGFVSDQKLEQFYSESRIAVVPLLYGGGMKGKVIEAMRFGIPLITTSIGLQGLKKASEFIPSTDNPQKFAELISEYLNNKEKWMKTSKDMVHFVKNNYSAEALWKIIAEDFAL